LAEWSGGGPRNLGGLGGDGFMSDARKVEKNPEAGGLLLPMTFKKCERSHWTIKTKKKKRLSFKNDELVPL